MNGIWPYGIAYLCISFTALLCGFPVDVNTALATTEFDNTTVESRTYQAEFKINCNDGYAIVIDDGQEVFLYDTAKCSQDSNSQLK